jgi:small-conductance mechanosensitive channel
LTRYYFPAIFLTFLTGILWCIGYHDLCLAIWRMTWAVVGAFLGIMVTYHILNGWLRQWSRKKGSADGAAQALYQSLNSMLLYATVITLLIVTLKLLGLSGPIRRVLSFPVLDIGGSPLSCWTLMKAAIILAAFVYFSRLLRAWLDYRIHPSVGVEEGLAYAINTFLHYTLLAIGFLVALRAVGLDLRVLMVFAGALGFGIGLGMQNTAANLIAGFSIIFGRRLRKGDLLQVGDTVGYVKEIGLRATKVKTLDNIEYLVPNAELTSTTIVNYTLSDPLIRVHVPVGVSYSADPKQVETLLLDAAKNNPNVIQSNPPQVWFTEFGDSSLNFELLVWTDVRSVGALKMRSDLYYVIFEALAEAGIEIPFPQRDLHIRSGLVPREAESEA